MVDDWPAAHALDVMTPGAKQYLQQSQRHDPDGGE